MQNEIFENVMNSENAYAKAFMKVCEIIEPNVEWTSCSVTTKIDIHGTSIKPNVYGFCANYNTNVYITTYKDPSQGQQIVITYSIGGEIYHQRSVWYYSFNWKSLMETK